MNNNNSNSPQPGMQDASENKHAIGSMAPPPFQLQAEGGDGDMGPGQEQHLPHEAWHEIPQRRSRIRPQRQTADDDPAQEGDDKEQQEADPDH